MCQLNQNFSVLILVRGDRPLANPYHVFGDIEDTSLQF